MGTIIRAAFVLAAVSWAGTAFADVVWDCEVAHTYQMTANGTYKGAESGQYIGDRFTVGDDTGALKDSKAIIDDSRDWKKVARRFGPDQDALQSIRSSDGRPFLHLYVETFATGPVKPFAIYEFGIGAARTGTCRAKQ